MAAGVPITGASAPLWRLRDQHMESPLLIPALADCGNFMLVLWRVDRPNRESRLATLEAEFRGWFGKGLSPPNFLLFELPRCTRLSSEDTKVVYVTFSIHTWLRTYVSFVFHTCCAQFCLTNHTGVPATLNGCASVLKIHSFMTPVRLS